MNFEWNQNKATANLEKHGVSFEEANEDSIRIISARKATKKESELYRRFKQ